MSERLITAGIDMGSATCQVVIMTDKIILAYANIIAGVNRKETANRALDIAILNANIFRKSIAYIVGTGYGRYLIPFCDKNVTEIACHARGANYFFPQVKTVLDIGGQDCKAIRCNEEGKVKAFAMNDKCAAGTGKSIEVIAKLMGVPLDQIGPLSLDIKTTPPYFNSACVVFAKSEALKMLRSGVEVNAVLAAYCEALTQRLVSLIHRIGLQEELAISGGVAKNLGVVKRVEETLRTRANICFEPQIVGAVGAALIAQKFASESGVGPG